jgi:hypothetical protein
MIVLTATQQVSLSISVVDRKGNPARVDGVPTWSVSDATVLTVEPASDGIGSDGMVALVKAVGTLGTAQVRVTADADLGEGVTPLVGVLDVEVLAAQAVAVSIAAGTPEEQA